MARKPNIQNILDSLFRQIGSEVARGVSDGLARSGLMKSIQALSRGVKKGRPVAARRGGKPGRRKKKPTACSVKGCKQPARAKGLCSKHYQKKRYAQLQVKSKKKPRKKAKKKKAAKRVVKKKRTKAGKRKTKKASKRNNPQRSSKTCKVKGCNKKVYARNLCGQHFMAWVRSKKK